MAGSFVKSYVTYMTRRLLILWALETCPVDLINSTWTVDVVSWSLKKKKIFVADSGKTPASAPLCLVWPLLFVSLQLYIFSFSALAFHFSLLMILLFSSRKGKTFIVANHHTKGLVDVTCEIWMPRTKGPVLVFNLHETKTERGQCKRETKSVFLEVSVQCVHVCWQHMAQQQAWLCERAKKTKCSPFKVLCWLKRVREMDYHVMPHLLLLLANILLQDMWPTPMTGLERM